MNTNFDLMIQTLKITLANFDPDTKKEILLRIDRAGTSFKIDLKTVGLKLEKFHNEHISGGEKPHGLPLKVGEWIKVKLTDKPDYTKGEIYQSIELNGQKVIEGTQKNLPPYLLKKEDYDKR